MCASTVDPLAQIPAPAERRLALRVSPAAERSLRRGHPWLYPEAITHQSHAGQPGDLAVIFDAVRRFLAIGLYDPTSPVRVRVLHRGRPETIDRAWLVARLAAAAQWRASLAESDTTGYRLVHGENDGLPGLVIDRYENALVLKLYTLGWVPHLADVRAALAEVWPDPAAALVLRLSRELSQRPEHLYHLTDGVMLRGELPPPAAGAPDGTVIFRENGLRFEADVLHGQKTGFFLDQRDNRAKVERLAAGRRTLNVFAYTGGFSLYAARGGAPEVTSIDASAPALAAAMRNFALNQDVPAVTAAQHTAITADAFVALAGLRDQGRVFDLVIVDPPAFAHQASDVNTALRAYSRLTALALGVLAPGGMLVMASCSSRVTAEAFFKTVNQAAIRAGRPLREFDRTGHAIDHPILFPEGAYLKCLFAEA